MLPDDARPGTVNGIVEGVLVVAGEVLGVVDETAGGDVMIGMVGIA
jgi:hypothetical protein